MRPLLGRQLVGLVANAARWRDGFDFPVPMSHFTQTKLRIFSFGFGFEHAYAVLGTWWYV